MHTWTWLWPNEKRKQASNINIENFSKLENACKLQLEKAEKSFYYWMTNAFEAASWDTAPKFIIQSRF